LLVDIQALAPEGHPYVFVSPKRLEMIKERRKIGKWNPRSELINNLSRDFNIIRRKAKLEDFTLHDLRRSAIKNWAQKLPIQVVQQLAGYASITTTRNYYFAVRSEDLQSASKWINKILATRYSG
jgi:integrase